MRLQDLQVLTFVKIRDFIELSVMQDKDSSAKEMAANINSI